MHWKEAQEQQRRESGGNAIFLPDDQAAITGYEEHGWLIVTKEQRIEAKTVQGVEMAIEELGLPALGWS